MQNEGHLSLSERRPDAIMSWMARRTAAGRLSRYPDGAEAKFRDPIDFR